MSADMNESGFRVAKTEVFSKDVLHAENAGCCIFYEPCLLQVSDVVKLEPNEQRFYVNHFGTIERRTCTLHPNTMCTRNATMDIRDYNDNPNPFHLNCVIALAHYNDDSLFCFTHLSRDCFAVVNYRRMPQPAPVKPLLTKSTYSMCIAQFPPGFVLSYNENIIGGTEIPGLQRFLFAMDHYGKECDAITQHYCEDVWDNFKACKENFDELLGDVLSTIIPSFEQCITAHRLLIKLWNKFSRSGTQCNIKDCMCVSHSDSDSDND